MDFFILSYPRSGSSLLRLMLNSHSQIGVPPECGMIQWWHDKYQNINEDFFKSSDFIEFKQDILSSKKIEGWGVTEHHFSQAMNDKPNSYGDFFSKFYRAYTSKQIVGDKNNYYIRYLDVLRKIYPKTKYIHICRDGRDVSCSLKEISRLDGDLRYKPDVPKSITEIAKNWVSSVLEIESFLKSTSGGLQVSYEELVTTPVRTLKEICTYLELDFEEDMLKYYLNNNEPESTIVWKKKTLQKLDKNNLGRYKSELTKLELELFEDIALDTLRFYGYEA